jgi:hypothetical protein
MRATIPGMAGRWVRRAVLAAVLLATVALAWGVLAALQARADVLAARAQLTDLRDGDGVDEDQVRATLDRAAGRLDQANGWMRQPGPWLAARLPVVGRSVRAVAVTTESARTVVDATRDVLDTAGGDAPVVVRERVDVARLRAMQSALDTARGRVRAAVDDLAALDTGLTPPAVGRAVGEALREFGAAADGLASGTDLLTVLESVLGSPTPRRLLFLLENNAELRGTGGLVSVFAEATAQDGRLRVEAFRDIDEVADHRTKARPVPAPPDYVDLYGAYLANTTLWKNANMSPDGPTSLGVVAELAELTLRRRPSLVVALDVPTVAAILDATGPARLPDGTMLTGANAQQQLLEKAYQGVPDTRGGQAERRRRLREAADVVVGKLLSGETGAVPLAGALGRMAAGRHVMWSDVPREQELLVAAGAAGALDAGAAAGGDLATFTVLNLGGGRFEGNKLDYYARRAVDVAVEVHRDVARVTRRMTLRNDAPTSGLTGYVGGLQRRGQSRNLVLVGLPATATVTGWARGETPIPVGLTKEGAHAVLRDAVDLDPGESATWLLQYDLPLTDGRYSLRLVPQPLVADAELTLEVRAGDRLDLAVRRGEAQARRSFSRVEALVVEAVPEVWWRRAGSAIRRFWDEPITIG